MENLTSIERAVLDTTARAPGNLEQIYQHLHAPPSEIPLSEAADAVWTLIEKGLLAPQAAGDEPLPDVPHRVWKARFEPTSRGRELLVDDQSEATLGRPEGRSYFGIWKGLIPDIPFEVFKENRREMAGKYSVDAPDE